MANLMILQELDASSAKKSPRSKHRKGSPRIKQSESPNKALRIKTAKSRIKHLASKTFQLWAKNVNQDEEDLAAKVKQLAAPTDSSNHKLLGHKVSVLKLKMPKTPEPVPRQVAHHSKYYLQGGFWDREKARHGKGKPPPVPGAGLSHLDVEGLIGKSSRVDKTLIADYEEMLQAVSKKPSDDPKKYTYVSNQIELRPTTPSYLPGKSFNSLKQIRRDNRVHKDIGDSSVFGRRLVSRSGSISKNIAPNKQTIHLATFEKTLGIEYLPTQTKLKNLGYLKPTLHKIQDLLKVAFGLFTQEKHELFFKQVKALVDIIFVYRLLPFELMKQLAQLAIEVFFDFSEFNKCNWVTGLLVKAIESKVAKDEGWNEKGNKGGVNQEPSISKPSKDLQIKQVRSLSQLNGRSSILKSGLQRLATHQGLSPASHKQLLGLLQLYQRQTKSFESSGQTEPALLSAYKWLFLSLYLNDSAAEISAYDSIGKIYTEIGEVVRGRYFNLKYSDCLEESDNSPIRKLYPELKKRFILAKHEVHGHDEDQESDNEHEIVPDLQFYESIPLKGQALLAELEEKRKEAYRKGFEEIREDARTGVTKDPLYAGLRKKKKPVIKKNLIGNISSHNGFVPTEATDDVQLLLSKAKIQFSNCSETVVLTHQSPNRTISIHHQSPNVQSNNPFSPEFAEDRVEPYLLEQKILPLVDLFNRAGLAVERHLETVEKLEQQYSSTFHNPLPAAKLATKLNLLQK